jgi:hypothetical protein
MFLGGAAIAICCYIGVLCLITPAYTAGFFLVLLFTLLCLGVELLSQWRFLKSPAVKTYHYALPTMYVGVLYMLVQATAGILMVLFLKNLTVLVLLELIIFGIFAALMLFSAGAAAVAQDTGETAGEERAAQEDLKGKAQSILQEATDYWWNREIKKLYDEVAYAKPAAGGTEALDRAISDALDRVRQALYQQNKEDYQAAYQQIHGLLAERTTMTEKRS